MPLVLCLTNTVAANFTANILLAIGAKPAMIEDPSEAAELAAAADAVLVNVGTLTPAQADVMRAAVRVCREKRVPWVLDPVACHLLSFRRAFVQELLESAPTAIRGNHDEIDFLLHHSSPFTFTSLATGETDLIRRGTEVIERITGGVPMLQSVTATGCAQGAICAAFLGQGQTPENALLSASRLMKQAGECAWKNAKTPGSFQIALLDALQTLAAASTPPTHHD